MQPIKFSRHKKKMISIENLCIYIERLVAYEGAGVFFPQDPEYVCTSEMVKEIAKKNNHTIYFTRIFNPIIKLCHFKHVKKIFGDLIYKDMEKI